MEFGGHAVEQEVHVGSSLQAWFVVGRDHPRRSRDGDAGDQCRGAQLTSCGRGAGWVLGVLAGRAGWAANWQG